MATVSLILSIDEQGMAQVLEFAKNVENEIGKIGESSKATGDAGRQGFSILGNAVNDAARSMGVADSASRLLGDSVSRMAASAFPQWGTALGVAGAAAAGLTVGIIALIQHKENLREATAKNADTLFAEVSGMWRSQGASEATATAMRNLYLAKRDMLLLTLPDKIKNENKELAEQEEILKKINSGAPGPVFEAGPELGEKYRKELAAKVKFLKAARDLDQAHLDDVRKNMGTGPELSGYGAAEQLQISVEKEKALYDLRKAQGTMSMEEQMAAELSIFDSANTQKLMAMKTAGASDQQVMDQFAVSDIQRDTLEAKSKELTEKKKQQYETQTLDHAANAFKTLATLSKGHGGTMFAMYQAAAIGKTIMATRTAMMEAYEEGGPYLGSALAAAIFIEGAASVAAIAAQKYDGSAGMGSGGSAGAVSASSASSATSQSVASTQPQMPALTLVINGQTTHIGELTEGVLRTLYDQNGSVGGLSVAVERSA